MPVWERYDGAQSHTAVGDHANQEVFHNEQAVGGENFEAAAVVAVDGILTVITDTDDLCGIRFIIAPEEILTGVMDEENPQPHSPMIWYSWFASRGPMVFRLRSKRTVPPESKLWVQTWKARGTLQTDILWGFHVLWVVKH